MKLFCDVLLVFDGQDGDHVAVSLKAASSLSHYSGASSLVLPDLPRGGLG
jgi:hypothetical protein